MMLVGTSLGGCLKSLAKGEVNIDDVLVVITRTAFNDIDGLMKVVERYHSDGNKYTKISDNYDIADMDLDTVKDIAIDLYNAGKIHQPRLYNGDIGFLHVEMSRNEIWIPLAPSPKTDDQRVVDAYEKYQIMRNLLA